MVSAIRTRTHGTVISITFLWVKTILFFCEFGRKRYLGFNDNNEMLSFCAKTITPMRTCKRYQRKLILFEL